MTAIAAGIDPLRDEGKAYAGKLRQAGVKVDYKLYSGLTHAFFGMGAVVPKAGEAEQYAADALKKAFEGKHSMASTWHQRRGWHTLFMPIRGRRR